MPDILPCWRDPRCLGLISSQAHSVNLIHKELTWSFDSVRAGLTPSQAIFTLTEQTGKLSDLVRLVSAPGFDVEAYLASQNASGDDCVPIPPSTLEAIALQEELCVEDMSAIIQVARQLTKNPDITGEHRSNLLELIRDLAAAIESIVSQELADRTL